MVLRWRRAQGLDSKDEATVMGNEASRSRYLSGSDLTVFLVCHYGHTFGCGYGYGAGTGEAVPASSRNGGPNWTYARHFSDET